MRRTAHEPARAQRDHPLPHRLRKSGFARGPPRYPRKERRLRQRIKETQGFNHLDKGDTFKVDKAIDDANPDDYDNVVLPGGVANPDFLRTNEKVVSFIRDFFGKGKPVAAICHGPWTLVEAGVVDGMTLTSWPSLKTDIENAGGHWVDEEVHVDKGLVTSRKPDDIPAFNAKMVEEFAEGRHEQLASAAGS
jgi:protease I